MGPLLFLIMLIPFTINGLGVREAFFIAFLGRFGVSADAAFGTGFLFYAMAIGASLPGALIMLWESLRPPPPAQPIGPASARVPEAAGTRKRLIIGLVVAVVLFAAGAAAAVWVYQQRHPADVRGSATEEFDTASEPGTTTRPEEEVLKAPWPTYGLDNQRTRVASDFSHRPPYDPLWRGNGKSLLEFP